MYYNPSKVKILIPAINFNSNHFYIFLFMPSIWLETFNTMLKVSVKTLKNNLENILENVLPFLNKKQKRLQK